ncbi:MULTISPECIES: hypothetical protein [unclassified Rossellomorea]|uniref:hypothetical protein n=1 Tax=unclassified Rossellomorea TaxID=2837526 RepID=UPI00261FD522|nr:hypothetical protein [uncultured Rossellomorea sp.]
MRRERTHHKKAKIWAIRIIVFIDGSKRANTNLIENRMLNISMIFPSSMKDTPSDRDLEEPHFGILIPVLKK